MTSAPFDLDAGYGGDLALGLIVLASDETVEPELAPVSQAAGLPLYHARIPSAQTVTPETLLKMEADLPATAALLPAAVQFGAIGYGCTSASTLIGPESVARAVQASHPGVPVTDPITAVLAACAHLDAHRIGFVTPYVAEVSAAMRSYLEEQGLEITGFTSFEQVEEATVARITETSVLEAVLSVGQDCDLVFASCTNLRSFGVIEAAEAQLGVPVISSNLALIWHMLRLAGREARCAGPGILFR